MSVESLKASLNDAVHELMKNPAFAKGAGDLESLLPSVKGGSRQRRSRSMRGGAGLEGAGGASSGNGSGGGAAAPPPAPAGTTIPPAELGVVADALSTLALRNVPGGPPANALPAAYAGSIVSLLNAMAAAPGGALPAASALVIHQQYAHAIALQSSQIEAQTRIELARIAAQTEERRIAVEIARAEISARTAEAQQLANLQVQRETNQRIGELNTRAMELANQQVIAERDGRLAPGRNRRWVGNALGIGVMLGGAVLSVGAYGATEAVRGIIVTIISAIEPSLFPGGAPYLDDSGMITGYIYTAINGVIRLFLLGGMSVKRVLLIILNAISGLVAYGGLAPPVAIMLGALIVAMVVMMLYRSDFNISTPLMRIGFTSINGGQTATTAAAIHAPFTPLAYLANQVAPPALANRPAAAYAPPPPPAPAPAPALANRLPPAAAGGAAAPARAPLPALPNMPAGGAAPRAPLPALQNAPAQDPILPGEPGGPPRGGRRRNASRKGKRHAKRYPIKARKTRRSRS